LSLLNPVFPDPFHTINVYIFVVVLSESLAIILGTIVLKRLLRDLDITWLEAALTVGVTAFVSFIVSLLIWFSGFFL